jgi:transposase
VEAAFLDTDGATNGDTEAINGLHRRIARGSRNRDNYRLRILLIGGGLDQAHPKYAEPQMGDDTPRARV